MSERNPDWDALVEVFGFEPAPSQRTLWGKHAKDLKAIRGDQDPSEYLLEACKRYRAEYPNVAFTPNAVMKHAPQLMATRKPGTRSMEDTLRIARAGGWQG